jgi:transcriptional regulator with XRE-family HTH domain
MKEKGLMTKLEATQSAKILHKAMKSAGVSQYTLSQKLNLPGSTLSRILSGKTKSPGIDLVIAAFNELGMEVWLKAK